MIQKETIPSFFFHTDMGYGFAWSFGGIGPYGVGGVLIDLCNENQHVNQVHKKIKQTKKEREKVKSLRSIRPFI